MTERVDVIIHADGACSGNPGPGGWAATVQFGSEVTVALTGGDTDTTNNRMELTAALSALKYVADSNIKVDSITLRLDSQYVLLGMSSWMQNWKYRNWRDAKGQPVKNLELWQAIDHYRSLYGSLIVYEHVKGHSGDKHNDIVDRLAVGSRELSKKKTQSWVGQEQVLNKGV